VLSAKLLTAQSINSSAPSALSLLKLVSGLQEGSSYLSDLDLWGRIIDLDLWHWRSAPVQGTKSQSWWTRSSEPGCTIRWGIYLIHEIMIRPFYCGATALDVWNNLVFLSSTWGSEIPVGSHCQLWKTRPGRALVLRGRQAAKVAFYLSIPNSQSCISSRCIHKGLLELLWWSDFSIGSGLESKFSRTQGSSPTIRYGISEGSRAQKSWYISNSEERTTREGLKRVVCEACLMRNCPKRSSVLA
jgi:hypothetical protein